MFNRDIVNIIVKYYDYNSFLFDFSIIEKYKDKINWNCLLENTNIPYTFFEKCLEQEEYQEYKDKINWNNLSYNTNIPYTFFEKYLEQEEYKDKINWYWLSQNTNIPHTFFEKYLEYPEYKNEINWDNHKIQIYHIHFLKNI